MTYNEAELEFFKRVSSSEKDVAVLRSILGKLKEELFDPETLTVENLQSRKDAVSVLSEFFSPMLGKKMSGRSLDPRDTFV